MNKKLLKIAGDIKLDRLKKYGFNKVTGSKETYYFKKVYLENDNDDRIFYYVNEKDRLLRISRIDSEILDDTILRLAQDNLLEAE